MGNLLKKAIKGTRKRFQLTGRMLGLPKGTKAYVLKRDGTDKPFTILAIFNEWGEEYSTFRASKTIQFATLENDVYTNSGTSLSMREVAARATHIAIVRPDGQNQVYSVRRGDDWLPYYFDWTYSFFVQSVSDVFVPTANV